MHEQGKNYIRSLGSRSYKRYSNIIKEAYYAILDNLKSNIISLYEFLTFNLSSSLIKKSIKGIVKLLSTKLKKALRETIKIGKKGGY